MSFATLDLNGLAQCVDAMTMTDVSPSGRTSAASTNGFQLPRLSGSAFNDLAVWMVGLGLATGLCFPVFGLALGVPAERALTPRFSAATVSGSCAS